MSIENPIQIDLSQENAWSEVDDSLLTSEEKAVLSERFNEESEGIIYLTQQEISELKAVIDTSDLSGLSREIQTGTRDGDIDNFIEEQIAEGLSSSDIFESMEGIPEELAALGGSIDAISQETLFGENGVMNNIELSDRSKDNIAVSLSLSSIAAIQGDNTLTIENFETRAQELSTSLSIINEIAIQTETTDEGDIPYKSILDIANAGDDNQIFRSPAEGKVFFDKIFSGDISAANLESYMEDKNLESPEDTEIDMDGLQNISRDGLISLAGNLGIEIGIGDEVDTSVLDEGDVDVPDVPTITEVNNLPPEERQSLLERWAESDNFILQILAAILSAGEALGLGGEESEDERIEGETEDDAEEIAPTMQQQARNLFRERITEGSITSFEASEIIALFPEDGELTAQALQIIRLIDSIPDFEGETDFESKFNNFFATNTSEGIRKIDAFIEASQSRMITEGESVASNLAAVMRSYIEYRENGERVPYTEWFESMGVSTENDNNTGRN